MYIKLIIKLIVLTIIIFLFFDSILTSSFDVIVKKLIIIGIVSGLDLIDLLYDKVVFVICMKKLKFLYKNIKKKIDKNSDEVFTESENSKINILIDKCMVHRDLGARKERVVLGVIKNNIKNLIANRQYKNLKPLNSLQNE